jgi:hypothetical protein
MGACTNRRPVKLSILGIRGVVEFSQNANYVVWHTVEKKSGLYFMPALDWTNRATICIPYDATET